MPSLSQHVCFTCRKVFKKPHDILSDRGIPWAGTVFKCPHCGGGMVYMGYKFRAPAARDTRGWKRIEQALKEGRDYGIQTIRKQKPKPKLNPKFRIALGIYGKKLPKKAA
jgi:hypothetical protein